MSVQEQELLHWVTTYPEKAADRITELEAQREELLAALVNLMDLNDNGGPFGGEIYQDRVERAWDAARSAIAKCEAKP